MQKDIIGKEIAEIIKDFRQSSVGIEINQAHVHKWVSQFNPDVQDTILEETLHILKKWYFGRDKISLFLNEIMNYLKLENKNATDADPFKGICFLDIQESGKSQIQLIEILKDEANKKYEVQEYIQKCYFSLKFSPVIETVVKNIKRNPKRMQREAKKQMLEIGIGTKSQQALKLQQEQNKQERKEKSRKKKEAEEQRMFELKDPFYPLPLRHLQRLFLHAPYSRTGIRCIIPEVLLF